LKRIFEKYYLFMNRIYHLSLWARSKPLLINYLVSIFLIAFLPFLIILLIAIPSVNISGAHWDLAYLINLFTSPLQFWTFGKRFLEMLLKVLEFLWKKFWRSPCTAGIRFDNGAAFLLKKFWSLAFLKTSIASPLYLWN
jgi:hypothetical protein